MSVLENYVDQSNINSVVQEFGENQGLNMWINEKDTDGYYVNVVVEISNNLFIDAFGDDCPDEWFDFLYEDIKKSDLQRAAEKLQETLITYYNENNIDDMTGKLELDIYHDYVSWHESKFEKEPDDDFSVSVKILFNYNTSFAAEDLIEERRVLRDNM